LLFYDCGVCRKIKHQLLKQAVNRKAKPEKKTPIIWKQLCAYELYHVGRGYIRREVV